MGAVSPDGILDEPGENGGKLGVEGAGINTLGDRFQDPDAASPLVTNWTVSVAGTEAIQDASPMQEVVHESVDHDHAAADFSPTLAALPGAQKNRRESRLGPCLRLRISLSEVTAGLVEAVRVGLLH